MWVVRWLGVPMEYGADFGSGAPGPVAPARMFIAGQAFMTPARAPTATTAASPWSLTMEPEHIQLLFSRRSSILRGVRASYITVEMHALGLNN